MDSAAPSPEQLFPTVGTALFRRAAHLLGDGEAARRATEDLFVRFVVYGRAAALDARARWAWIYRVATAHCLRLLPDDARLGIGSHVPAVQSAPVTAAVGSSSVPADMRALRALDEATRIIVVLARFDGLSPDEVAEVVGLPAKLVRRRLTPRGGSTPTAAPPDKHPSLLALDRDRGVHAAHIAACARCGDVVAEADRLAGVFARDLAPSAAARVAAAVRRERARATGPGWRRALWLTGALVLVAGLALLVARPHAADRSDTPYAGLKGASRAQASGVQIEVARGPEVRALDPGTVLRPGDRLHFRVRGERPRFLELRVRDGATDVRVFPTGGTDAVLVRPGEALAAEYVVADAHAADKIWIVGQFADQAFAVDRRFPPEAEIIAVRADLAR